MALPWTVRGGNVLTGRAGLEAGQETMKADAMVNTSLMPSGVSKAAGMGFPLFAPMM
jgi:hypothetical protein